MTATKMDYNFNYGFSVDASLFVLDYVKFVIPVLTQIQQWPAEYMLDRLQQYLDRHRSLLEEHDLWGLVETFRESQAAK